MANLHLMSGLDREIQKTQQEITDLDRQLVEKRAFLAGLQRAARLLPHANGLHSGSNLRPGSLAFRVAEVLRASGAPLHIEKIFAALKQPMTPEKRSSLVGSLGTYVRKNQVFTRPLPNTFGLIEFQQEGESHGVNSTFIAMDPAEDSSATISF